MTADDVQEKLARISQHAKTIGLLEAEAILRSMIERYAEDGATWRAEILREAADAIAARVDIRDSADRRMSS